MKTHEVKPVRIPTMAEVSAERARLRYKQAYCHTVFTTVYALLVVAAVAVLLVMLLFPVLQVVGTSMEPTLQDGDVILLVKTDEPKAGQLVGFYWQNKLLLKRVIGLPGDTIEIDGDGVVSVNGVMLDEPYLSDLGLGECDIVFPYQVPDGQYFVMGDERQSSIDSRSSIIGCVAADQLVGRVVARVWPVASGLCIY